ncbi:hypothetical protein NH8B_2731 [Pseudogulbenkiania sp. NH8B]|uniref:hypothetical protein n=1 Tax=Pseudogulbenkiania sp. (strain NH8B) TaxID=748280 RepID=UPI0002279B69|nr:hypothetical protein [Pseudogulbenkiania sp. NH8B]BAK77529.1 hypothetical protein NH8B_2731 [Pseudogulbenkiania sp. NH8B]
MKKIALVVAGLLVAGSVFAKDSYVAPTDAQVQAWQAEQGKIKASYAQLPPAEQARLSQQNAYWSARWVKENQASR